MFLYYFERIYEKTAAKNGIFIVEWIQNKVVKFQVDQRKINYAIRENFGG